MVTKRLTLELDADGERDLCAARELSGVGTYADTVRLALRVLAALLREREDGHGLMLERGGELAEVTLPTPGRAGLDWVDGPSAELAGGEGSSL